MSLEKLNKKFLPLLFTLLFSSLPAFSIELYNTSQKFTDPKGQYVEQRKVLHNKIFRTYLQKIVRLKTKNNPNGIFMAGGPGAGKSYSLNLISKAGLIDLNFYVLVNSDDIKEMIPEFNEFKKIDAKKAADLVHEESSFIKDKILDETIKRRVNFILDGTFSNIEQSKKILQKLKRYKTKIVFVDAPTEVLLKRVEERGKRTGRYVPTDYVKSAAEGVRTSINELSKFADVTFFIASSDNTAIKEIRWKEGKKLIVNTPLNRLTKKQVQEFKKLLDP